MSVVLGRLVYRQLKPALLSPSNESGLSALVSYNS
jgi:hypothetical protein